MWILGISAFYHDSAAALVRDGEIIAAAQEERFTRKKHDSGLPVHAVQACLDIAGIGTGDLDYVAFYDKPILKFERLLETYFGVVPSGLRSFLAAMPVWLKEKLWMTDTLRHGLWSAERCPEFIEGCGVRNAEFNSALRTPHLKDPSSLVNTMRATRRVPFTPPRSNARLS